MSQFYYETNCINNYYCLMQFECIVLSPVDMRANRSDTYSPGRPGFY